MNAKNGYRDLVGSFDVDVSKLLVEPTDRHNGRRRIWMLSKPFKVVINHAGGASSIHVPAGFETDFASFPWIVSILLGKRDAVGILESSITHDWFCVNNMPGFYANSTMRVLMTALGVPGWKVLAIFYGLQLWGYGSATFNFFTLGKFRRDAQQLGK